MMKPLKAFAVIATTVGLSVVLPTSPAHAGCADDFVAGVPTQGQYVAPGKPVAVDPSTLTVTVYGDVAASYVPFTVAVAGDVAGHEASNASEFIACVGA